jgi:hypothetical protein
MTPELLENIRTPEQERNFSGKGECRRDNISFKLCFDDLYLMAL